MRRAGLELQHPLRGQPIRDNMGKPVRQVTQTMQAEGRDKPDLRLVVHRRGAPGLRRWPGRVAQLCRLFNADSFWAQQRDSTSVRRMLKGSDVTVSVWQSGRLVGFGRATSDGVYRAMLWDVIVAQDLQRLGIGRRIVEALLRSKALRKVEQVALMTTYGQSFYENLGFKVEESQKLMKICR